MFPHKRYSVNLLFVGKYRPIISGLSKRHHINMFYNFIWYSIKTMPCYDVASYLVSVKFVFVFLAVIEHAHPDDVKETVPHPMLYFSQQDIPQLRHKAAFTHGKIVSYIREAAETFRQDPRRYLPPESHKIFSSIWNEHFGNNLCMLSMHCVLYPDDNGMFQLLTKYMDRMASYPDWYVESSRGKDQVPIGHSLTGFATAFDFLYRRFNKQQQDLYYQKIKNTTVDLYRLFQIGRVEWAKQYIHNHAPSNLVAFLLGSLVVSKHEEKTADDWLRKVRKNLDFALEIFSYVIDGSVDEGVSYGSYTTRGITQYIYLAKRHFGIDHSKNPWLLEHFWFLYYTILPGYQRTVGIGDANYHWFYGPESQIHLLESYVLHNGYGNWLADKVRNCRSKIKPLAQSTAQIWSTLHTEFLFYNESITTVQPTKVKKLHVFSDWGVVTYGGGQEMRMGNTFLSFKSSVPNGEAVQDLIQAKEYPEWIEGWKNFNAGHEHPDQNSFVFVPNGRYVVSESLYGPKMTHLDNTVVFSPSATSKCNQPWEGQIGECNKWLIYKLYDNNVRGKILTATTSGEMVFIAGEAVGAYSKSLKLSSVFRATLLLNSEVLIVVDTIRRYEESKTTKASFLFHNTWQKFKPHQHLGFKGAKVEYPEGSYSMITVPLAEGITNLTIHENVQPAGLREGPTNYINVTVPLRGQVTNVVHIFSGPNYRINSLNIEPVSAISGISLTLEINDQKHHVNIATFVKSLKKQLEPSRERKRITNFNGFAQVKIVGKLNDSTHYFGLDSDSYNNGNGPVQKPYLILEYLHSDTINKLPLNVPYTTSFDNKFEVHKITHSNNSFKTTFEDEIQRIRSNVLSSPSRSNLLIAQSGFFVVLIIGLTLTIRALGERSKVYFQLRQASWHIPCVFAISTFLLNCYCLDVNGKNVCFSKTLKLSPMTAVVTSSWDEKASNLRMEESQSPFKITIPTNPFIMMTSLPGSGGYIFEKVFQESMVTYLSTRNLNIPVHHGNTNEIDLCLWGSEESHQHRLDTMGWFNSMKTKPILHMNQQRNNPRMEDAQRMLRQNLNSPIVMNDDCGFWTTKLPWVKAVVGKESFQPVIVVRDPRSWIYTMLKSHSEERSDSQLYDLIKYLEKVDSSCNKFGSKPPFYHDHFKATQSRRKYDDIEKLAVMWTVTIGSAMANIASDADGSWPTHVIRFEDILRDPESTTTDLFAKLGLPLGLKSLNKIVRTVKSGKYTSPHDGAIDSTLLTSWKTGLAGTDIQKIESICGGLFEILGYKFFHLEENPA